MSTPEPTPPPGPFPRFGPWRGCAWWWWAISLIIIGLLIWWAWAVWGGRGEQAVPVRVEPAPVAPSVSPPSDTAPDSAVITGLPHGGPWPQVTLAQRGKKKHH